jgi:oxalate decarboxylase/phosphoglucose isomerase-like protein (cupin superfamily)
MSSNIDYTSPTTQFTFDVNDSTFFKKDNKNFINILSINQLNTLENVSLLDIFLSTTNVIEPHYHQNAAELVYCISGAATVSLLNPFTKQLQDYPITPGQVANVPQGWWHYEVATVDNTHILAIFDAPTPEVILGSDILKLTPSNIMAHTYCMDESQWKKAIAPVKPSTFIGPPVDCNKAHENISYQSPPFIDQFADQMCPYTYQK